MVHHWRQRLAAAVLCLISGFAATVVVGAPAAGAASGYYIAMGDSYSSGEGAPPYDAGTAVDGNMCHQGPSGWPRLLAANPGNMNFSGIDHIACSGAVAANITDTPQRTLSPDNTTQLQQLTSLIQRGHVPSLVTITISGNDLLFASGLAGI